MAMALEYILCLLSENCQKSSDEVFDFADWKRQIQLEKMAAKHADM